MQIISIHNVLEQLAHNAGVDQIERFFEKTWNPGGSLGRTKGRGRAGKRGQNLPTNRSLTILEERLATLYEGHRWPLLVDCYQLLWLSLLVERPILSSTKEFLEAHHTHAKGPNTCDLLTIGLSLLEEGSVWKFSVWVSTKHASLPYLAGCIVLLRFCAEKRLPSLAHKVAEVVCRLLAMLGPELQGRGIGASMLHYCTEHILPLGGIHTTPGHIAHAAALLDLAALAPWPDDSPIEWEIRRSVMSEILSGTFGASLQHFCDPLALSMPRHQVAKCTRSLHKPNLRRTRSSVGAEAYRDRVIDLSGFFARVPAMRSWMLTDPRFVATKPSIRARRSSWCDGLSGAGSRGMLTG